MGQLPRFTTFSTKTRRATNFGEHGIRTPSVSRTLCEITSGKFLVRALLLFVAEIDRSVTLHFGLRPHSLGIITSQHHIVGNHIPFHLLLHSVHHHDHRTHHVVTRVP